MEKYTSLRRPISVVEDLKVWKAAYEMSYAKDMTYAEVLQRLTECVSKGDSAVHDMYETIMAKRGEYSNAGK